MLWANSSRILNHEFRISIHRRVSALLTESEPNEYIYLSASKLDLRLPFTKLSDFSVWQSPLRAVSAACMTPAVS